MCVWGGGGVGGHTLITAGLLTYFNFYHFFVSIYFRLFWPKVTQGDKVAVESLVGTD